MAVCGALSRLPQQPGLPGQSQPYPQISPLEGRGGSLGPTLGSGAAQEGGRQALPLRAAVSWEDRGWWVRFSPLSPQFHFVLVPGLCLGPALREPGEEE